MDDLIRGLAEDINVLFAHLLADLHIGTVHGAQRQRTVQHELHVAGAGGLLGGKADLLGQVTGRDELFGSGDVVIFHKYHLQPLGHLRVCGDDLGEGQQGMDDVLGNGVGRSSLGTKDTHQWHGRQVPCLDLIILMDEVQQVQLLTLILVQPLGLDIEHGIGVHCHLLGAQQPVCQRCLVGLFHGGQLVQHGFVVGEGQQLLQLGSVLTEAGTDVLFQRGGQARVTFQQPAAEGDAVGLVVELFRVQLIEAVQLGIFQDLGVQRCHAVGGMGEVDVHVGHVYPVVLVDDGKALVLGAGAGQCVQLFNDGHQLGHHCIQIGAGPLFQCLSQNGVVGVGTGLGNDLHSFLKLNAPLPQQPDQLRDDHTGVSVVDLDGGVVGQIMVIAAPGGALCQNELGTGRNHEVLLIHPQTAACLIGVVRVEEQGQVLVDGGLVKGNAVMDDALVDGIQIEQIQGVGAALVTGDSQLVQPGSVFLARQLHRVGHIGLFSPAVGGEPGVGLFVLHTILKGLVEQAKVIPQAHAVAGQVQRCQRIQEAGCQTAQTTVAERGLRFHFLNIGKTLSGSGQCIPGFLVQSQIDEVVGQQLADKKFGADIV